MTTKQTHIVQAVAIAVIASLIADVIRTRIKAAQNG